MNRFPRMGAFLGSPPRMREEYMTGRHNRTYRRITPAHAGRIARLEALYVIYQDHPRACGKNAGGESLLACSHGSPPRMREEYKLKHHLRLHHGITPAHAGRIGSSKPAKWQAMDHPRACGKNAIACLGRNGGQGSPPRMREE